MRKWVVLSVVGLLVGWATIPVMALETAQKEQRMMTGVIAALDAKAMTLTVRDEVEGGEAEEIKFTVDPNATIRVHGLRGKLEQLKPGDVVTVKYVVKEGKNLAIEIQHM